ncbi:DNA primase [Granulicatella sp. zg-ZJ]|uniref:DNA primase n=1 Tax=Granulicatella sp. zg-ZJ TaxID=2678504 RepID=UPI0013D7358C|nr:DNA primase [Granulicatella sp. zg-ZJ]NEW62549.1 DNA primase [Granulicatella sp. zg-ZJ]
MVMIPEEKIQYIKQHTNIVDIIDQYVSLKKSGKNHFGFCPFHEERTPSFSVSEEKQIYKCFSCGRAGNVFSFFMEKEGITFPEAVKKVADLNHLPLELPEDVIEKSPKTKQIDTLKEIHHLAADFYHHVLVHTKEGEEALSYLYQRGITDETIRTFQLGVAPHSRDLLTKLLIQKGYTKELMEQSGLFSIYQESFLDRFFDRIMVPLRNDKGECVAFSGRIYLDTSEQDDKKAPKYLNSPETLIFQKSAFLFNLDLAKANIRKQTEFMLCEGYMDVIATWQAGITNSVASMGTSLTVEQINMLQRLANKVLIAYDGDHAGLNATDRAIQLFREHGKFDIYVLPMLDGMDPDELIRSKGNQYFLNYIAHDQETAFHFYKRFYRMQYTLDTQRSQIDYLDDLLKQVLFETSLTTRAMYIQDLADEFHLPMNALNQQLAVFEKKERQKNKNKERYYQKDVSVLDISLLQPSQTILKARDKAQRQLLYRLFTSQEAFQTVQTLQDIPFLDNVYQNVYLYYVDYRKTHHFDDNIYDFLDYVPSSELKNTVASILTDDFQETVSSEEMQDLLEVLRIEQLKDERAVLVAQVSEAAKSVNKDEVTRLLEMIQVLDKKINKRWRV